MYNYCGYSSLTPSASLLPVFIYHLCDSQGQPERMGT